MSQKSQHFLILMLFTCVYLLSVFILLRSACCLYLFCSSVYKYSHVFLCFSRYVVVCPVCIYHHLCTSLGINFCLIIHSYILHNVLLLTCSISYLLFLLWIHGTLNKIKISHTVPNVWTMLHFKKDLLATLILWFCPEFFSRGIKRYLVFSQFTSRRTSLLATNNINKTKTNSTKLLYLDNIVPTLSNLLLAITVQLQSVILVVRVPRTKDPSVLCTVHNSYRHPHGCSQNYKGDWTSNDHGSLGVTDYVSFNNKRRKNLPVRRYVASGRGVLFYSVVMLYTLMSTAANGIRKFFLHTAFHKPYISIPCNSVICYGTQYTYLLHGAESFLRS